MVSLHAFVLAAALAGNGDLVLLDFSAQWCAPCRSMEPTMQRLAQAGYPVRRVDVEADRDLARRFNIGPIPCFVLLKDGREVQRIVGATSYEQLAQLFQQ
ncbi:MAG: thioredoxin family protein, partial [Anaerolineae bacterium]